MSEPPVAAGGRQWREQSLQVGCHSLAAATGGSSLDPRPAFGVSFVVACNQQACRHQAKGMTISTYAIHPTMCKLMGCSGFCWKRFDAWRCRVLVCWCDSLQVPVVFFSLLRKGTPDRDRSEAKLAEAFDYVSPLHQNQHLLLT